MFLKALSGLLSDKDEVIENLALLRETVSDTSELEKQLSDAETEMALLAEMVQETVSENAHKAQDQKAYAEKHRPRREAKRKVIFTFKGGTEITV